MGAGLVRHKALHYIINFKIGGMAGVVAPLIGKQPPDMHIWVVKSLAPKALSNRKGRYMRAVRFGESV